MKQYTQADMGLPAYSSFIILLAPLLWHFFSFSFIHGAQSQLRVESIKSLEIKCLRLTSKEFTSDHINLEPLFTRNSATQINVPASWSCDEWGPHIFGLVFICLHTLSSKDWLVHKTFPRTTQPSVQVALWHGQHWMFQIGKKKKNIIWEKGLLSFQQ